MKIGVNDKCSCGSEIKYKKCCMGKNLVLKGKNAEEFIHELSKKTFFEDWCYLNPKFFDGKELCDVLILFEDILIIWQIKDLKLKKGKYDKGEVEKNLRQLCGAKRMLLEAKKPINLVNSKREETFSPEKIKKVYLISALVGEGEDYYSFAELKKENQIHTFTRKFSEIVLEELDTIKDFIRYLEEKEKLISKNTKINISGGEEEFLSYYLRNEKSFSELFKAGLIIISEGLWEDFQKKEEYKLKKEEDKISYIWDEIIRFSHSCGENYEIVAQELAKPDRFERRQLSKAFFDACKIADKQKEMNVFRRFVKMEGITFCFMMKDGDREIRRNLLQATSFVSRGLNPENNKVLGIATEMTNSPLRSYDFCLMDFPEWSEENDKEMKRIQKELKIFTNPKVYPVKESEYPTKE
jgi:gamma-glutamylcyclotransferase (GGCT)/AIG2-like uncharacterized protein YtfP